MQQWTASLGSNIDSAARLNRAPWPVGHTTREALFQQHPDLGPPNLISVRTLDHVVYLSGEVSAREFSAAAESVAHEVPGVTKVVNSIALAH